MKRLLALATACLVSLTIGMWLRFPDGRATTIWPPGETLPASHVEPPTSVPVLTRTATPPEAFEPAISDESDALALVVPVERTAVRAAASDTLHEVPVRVGDRVSAREVVAHLREDEIVAERKRRTAHVAVARWRIRAAEAEHELARYELGLEEKLSRAHSAAQAHLVASQRRVQATSARLEAAREELAMAQHAVDSVEQSLERYRILAPFAGRVTEVLCHSGQYVEEGDVLLWIESQEKRLKLHLQPEQVAGRERPRVSILLGSEWREVGDGVPGPGYNPDGTITVTVALNPSEEFVSGRTFPARIDIGESES